MLLLASNLDYTNPKGSFTEYIYHDLIVNEVRISTHNPYFCNDIFHENQCSNFNHVTIYPMKSVYEEGLQYLDTLGSDDALKKESPVYRSMKGLPPLCITTSEHECVYDHNVALCNNARKEGIEVDLGVWKYMSHVWPVWSAFLPEAIQAVDFTCNWIKKVAYQHGK